ncbi:MAG TPA: sigma-70 family RNA polymerase sigma factor [Planctomycetes bacterium]|nr:sigma-70 family RNA polymerase sigma factor [Planctomycetota bacterium]
MDTLPTHPAGEPTPPDWGHLAAGILRGDGELLGRWYELEWPTVYRLCFGLLADHAEAEDCAQDAMLRLRNRIASWDSTRAYEPWRRSVVLNLCRDHGRRQRARRDAEQAGAIRRTATHGEDPAANAELEDDARMLATALSQLPEREREAFVLRDLEEETTENVARIMGIAASSVRSLLALARRRLRHLLEPALGTEGDEREAAR